jgi:uncharacterized protein (UPF0276 family)
MKCYSVPNAAGVGLRFPHYAHFLKERPPIPWIEVSPENHRIGVRQQLLEDLRADYPLSAHGVGLSLGSHEPLSKEHLQFLKDFCVRFEPSLVSEHIAWSSYGGAFLNDLLPLPYTEESLKLIVAHIQETQEFLGRKILVENPSSYLCFETSSMMESEFMVQVAKQSGCGILLDVNNVYVSAHNHGFDATSYIESIPSEMIGEIHLAGHQKVHAPNNQTLLIDHHGDAVADAVWDLFEMTLALKGAKPTLIEWDTDIPSIETLLHEASLAQRHIDKSSPLSPPGRQGDKEGGKGVR